MMQFLLMADDGDDSGALDRRLAAREAHLARARELQAAGVVIAAGARLDPAGKMIGSVVLLEAPDAETVARLVSEDPYTLGGVWTRWEITPIRLAIR